MGNISEKLSQESPASPRDQKSVSRRIQEMIFSNFIKPLRLVWSLCRLWGISSPKTNLQFAVRFCHIKEKNRMLEFCFELGTKEIWEVYPAIGMYTTLWNSLMKWKSGISWYQHYLSDSFFLAFKDNFWLSDILQESKTGIMALIFSFGDDTSDGWNLHTPVEHNK